MGLFFGRDKTDEKLSQLHVVLSDSFAKVKQDSALLSQWVEYLYHLSIEQQRAMNDMRSRNNQLQGAMIEMERYSRRQNDMIRDLQLQLKHMPSSREEIRKIVDSFYSFEPILARLKHVEHKVAELETHKPAQHPPISQPAAKEMPSLKEKILRRITRNSKNFIKSSILSLLAKYGKISALQMREMIVEEQGLCSKSSFYRLLEELEKNEGLRFISDGKEKVYFAESVHAPHIKAEHSL